MNSDFPHFRWSFLPILLIAFLAPIAGGQVPTDPAPISGGILGSMLGGASLSLLTRALFALIAFGALGIILVKKRVIVIPKLSLALSLIALVGFMALSLVFSSFAAAGIVGLAYWVLLAGVFFLTVAVCGRREGIRWVLIILGASSTITAGKGIFEYVQLMAVEPGHRIFADWLNPNAVAGLFLMVLPLFLALSLAKSFQERLLGFCGFALSATALFLTQSKGGLLAGLLACLLFCGLAVSQIGLKRMGPVALCLLLASLLTGGLLVAAKKASAGGETLARVANASSSADQSVGFRSELWKGTLALMKERPEGWGPGSYRFVSAKPGLTEQTVLAHDSFLQIGVEGGILSLAAAAFFFASWLRIALSAWRKVPGEIGVIRSAVLAAVVATGAHSLIESNLYYTGIGVLTMVLLGLGVQLAPDASSPEVFPERLRISAALVGCFGAVVLCLLQGVNQMAKAAFLSLASGENPASAKEALDDLVARYPQDPEALYLRGLYSPTPDERLDYLRKASDLQPSTKYLRAAAEAARAAGKPDAAKRCLSEALRLDPNSLRTRLEFMKLEDSIGDKDAALAQARGLIEVENTPYFKIRSLPELVPTETYEARMYLAKSEENLDAKAALLAAAVHGFLLYRESTIPQVKAMTAAGLPSFGGESLQTAKQKMDEASDAALSLSEAYSGLGKSVEARDAKTLSAEFLSAFSESK